MDIEQLIPFALGGLFLGALVLVIVVSRRQSRRAREHLTRLASDLGLQLIEGTGPKFLGPPMPTVAGTFRGRQVRLFTYSTGSGKNRVQWCALASPLRNPAGLTLRISKENFLTRVGRKVGIDDVAVGDEAFDREFYVKSNKPDFIRAALIPEVRERVRQTWNAGAHGSVAADGAEIKYAETGSFANAKVAARFTAIAGMVCDVAEVVEACPG